MKKLLLLPLFATTLSYAHASLLLNEEKKVVFNLLKTGKFAQQHQHFFTNSQVRYASKTQKFSPEYYDEKNRTLENNCIPTIIRYSQELYKNDEKKIKSNLETFQKTRQYMSFYTHKTDSDEPIPSLKSLYNRFASLNEFFKNELHKLEDDIEKENKYNTLQNVGDLRESVRNTIESIYDYFEDKELLKKQ